MVNLADFKHTVKRQSLAMLGFIKEHKWQIAVFGGVALAVMIIPDSVSFAQTTGITQGGFTPKEGAGNISALEKPLAYMANFMTGPVPKALCTIGVAVGAASWAMNIENQITKTAMRVVGGSSVALGAASFINDTSGFLFK